MKSKILELLKKTNTIISKRIVLSIAAVLMLTISSFADSKDDVNKMAMKAFHKDFASARSISWEQNPHFVKVTFTMNSQVLCAFYNNNGDLQAVVRNLVSDQLSINLLADLKNTYTGFWISDLFEMVTDDQTSYYVTLENADKKIVLTSVGTNGWSVYSKTKKNVQ
jgi:hypothetical protein